MYQANQRAMVQQANMILVNIRTAEVAYFSNFFSNFGTQAAIVAGIICGAISQTPGLYDYPCAWVWVFTYFTASAMTLVLACHVLLCCLFTSVFGQGLAIRGPLGSMVHTIDGMVKEQHQIVFAFVLTIAFFVVQEAGMFMIVMDYTWGIVCVVIVFTSLAYTYNTTLRIYNRFYYEKEKVEWRDEANPVLEFNDLNADADAAKNVPRAESGGESPKRTPKVDGKVVKGNTLFADPFHDYSSADGISGHSAKELLAVDAFEGYLAVKTNKRFTTDPWERRYAVVTGHNLFFYKDKKTFTLNPADPINRRPVDLEGYAVHAGANELPYPITLTPVESDDIRKAWKFRCDTLAEFSMWKEIFATTVARANAKGAAGGR